VDNNCDSQLFPFVLGLPLLTLLSCSLGFNFFKYTNLTLLSWHNFTHYLSYHTVGPDLSYPYVLKSRICVELNCAPKNPNRSVRYNCCLWCCLSGGGGFYQGGYGQGAEQLPALPAGDGRPPEEESRDAKDPQDLNRHLTPPPPPPPPNQLLLLLLLLSYSLPSHHRFSLLSSSFTPHPPAPPKPLPTPAFTKEK